MTGFININKAAGVSSAREVAIIKRLTGMPCGHMGTLDPMADGVLPIGIGNACRLFDYFLTKRKKYAATFKFGVGYDTLDTTGTLEVSGGRVPSEEEIAAVLPHLTGEIMQIPPKYSAKNVGGKRGYELARAGVDFTLPPKKVNIYSISLTSRISADEFSFIIECGGGTYIRSICRDMASSLGTYAAMSALTRLSSGAFCIEDARPSALLTAENIADFIVPTDSVLPFKGIYVGGNDQKRFLNGLPVPSPEADGTYKIYLENGQFYGLGKAANGCLKVETKLC